MKANGNGMQGLMTGVRSFNMVKKSESMGGVAAFGESGPQDCRNPSISEQMCLSLKDQCTD